MTRSPIGTGEGPPGSPPHEAGARELSAGSGERPIFVIGCARSGTTLLRSILDAHPQITCGEETQFLEDMAPIVGRHWRLLVQYGFPKSYWLDRIRELFSSFKRDYMIRQGKRRWAEKSPIYTLYLPFIDRLYPDAQYIHIIRDGRDVVASHLERWGYRDAIWTARAKWVRFVTIAREFGRRLPPERYHELRYEELVADPEPVLRRMFEFLGEEWDERVLDHAAPRDAGGGYAEFVERRRREAGETRAIYRNRVGAARLDPILRTILHIRAGHLLRELGYVG